MISGLFALIVIFGIVSVVAFLHEKSPKEEGNSLKAADFMITEQHD